MPATRPPNLLMRLVSWCVACAAVATGAGVFVRAQESARPVSAFRDPIIEVFAADAAALPPEFAADVMIRLAGSARVADPAWRRELLDEAFMRAYGAQEQYRRSSAQPIPPDSRQGAQFLALATALTRVSLQVRVSQRMAFADPARARELFEWIELNLSPGVCEDPLVPAVDEYYSALSLVARTAFGADRAEAMRFFERHLWRARLPSELPAVARAVQRFSPKLDEAIYLESVVRWIVEGSARDPRGFSSANLDIVSRVADLQQADHRQGVPGWYLLDGLREYLLGQLTGPRCADSTTEQMIAPAFNGAVARLGAAREVDRIDDRTVYPSKLLAAARIDYYWQTPDAWRLYRNEERLRSD